MRWNVCICEPLEITNHKPALQLNLTLWMIFCFSDLFYFWTGCSSEHPPALVSISDLFSHNEVWSRGSLLYFDSESWSVTLCLFISFAHPRCTFLDNMRQQEVKAYFCPMRSLMKIITAINIIKWTVQPQIKSLLSYIHPQTHMTSFLPWDTKGKNMNQILVALFYTITMNRNWSFLHKFIINDSSITSERKLYEMDGTAWGWLQIMIQNKLLCPH